MRPPAPPNFGDAVIQDDGKDVGVLKWVRDIAQLRNWILGHLKQNRTFTKYWYEFFNGTSQFLMELRNAPQQVAQADLAKLTRKLTKSDVGMQVWIPVYNHMIRFDGTAWDWAPGMERSNWYALFEPTGPLPAAGSGWVLGDGVTTYDVLLGDGTIMQVTPAAVADTYYRL